MSYKVDFHIHSYYSDGTMKPTDLVRMYHDNEYDMISITDHDGIDGVNEAVIAGEALKIKVIPGIEFSTIFEKKYELHILGYYFDIENAELKERLSVIRNERQNRNEKLLKVFNDLGYDISFADCQKREHQDYIGKPDFAMALVKKGYIKTPKEAFKEGDYIESEEARKIKKDKISSEEAIELLNKAGGIAVLAHPMKIKGLGEKGSKEFFQALDEMVRKLKKAGLKGIECYHPSASQDDSWNLVNIAGKYHLHITEGSDFHGPEFT